MEELQDAIEDAQYVNAIATQEEGPRPVLAWEKPTDEQLAIWDSDTRRKASPDGPKPFSTEWSLQSAIGLFLFSEYLKEICNDYHRINFVEDVIRWKGMREKRKFEKAVEIYQSYLAEYKVDPHTGAKIKPPKTQITEMDLEREIPSISYDDVQFLFSSSVDPTFGHNCVGLKGSILRDISETIKSREDEMKASGVPSEVNGGSSASMRLAKEKRYESLRELTQTWRQKENPDALLPNTLFDKAEVVVVESLRRQYWKGFAESDYFRKFRNFLWFRDRLVVPDDFFNMRVLGRGGFGSVIACKRGVSGKLYAMKVMDKKRIKLKKSELLTVNERVSLAAVESPFVVNLKYSFHTQESIFLILDLMTGGDLGYHLQQKGKFPKKECLYYAARIMLGLQALHDEGYVYRDLKPENCLLDEDGRVKITDLGLTTKITPTLHGAAGTRGYWAPEMLRRDKKGKRMAYGHTVDWFSYGCCVAEFISGANPFRSEAALSFGLEAGMETKEKAIDHATLEMHPEFPDSLFEKDAADLCAKLLEKDEKKRLGTQGCEEIMVHPWFKNLNWESIISDQKKPPYTPPKDVNAAPQSEIGTFHEDKKHQETVLELKDERYYKDWDWTNPHAYAAEVIEFLIYERETGEPLLPVSQNTGCCCIIM
mmetsp:Transcript_40352/g.97444  ORF Transcript_40352/g.97444 Transcript_40352/m.97444 type:complete len:653 (+) Transcript_40352:236-2194(+)|eukprot:CAMPEP_0113631594 /NCGR_PEP_ID=MMETSP0017_2-20120614/16418_1 /TAXON_ID=2856 /ORGANISM="Cylindrotheca closterium" /LENGTH=652 /DNA_ID=CAMNT_0000542109 /DNA_START=165 /DNA_END=2123 /DNA_ORIENTATION=- /assembly_acc=CAM_ASM_000147